MLHRLVVDNFRALQHFEMDGLGRINLLVGTNNCGKSSVLEAIHALSSTGDAFSLWTMLIRRGEYVVNETARSANAEGDICHLFHGHEIAPQKQFSILGLNRTKIGQLTATVIDRPMGLEGEASATIEKPMNMAPGDVVDMERPGSLSLTLRWDEEGKLDSEQNIPITRAGGIRLVNIASGDRNRRRQEDWRTVRFISTAALGKADILALFGDVVLTPEEDVLIEALNIIDPSIERIASLGDRPRFVNSEERGGIVVKCRGLATRIPIGSMGDGIWRMLGIALCLIRAKDGILLVDEIDTGLHYTVMADMWRLVCKTARRLNVQVFATTHSSDCYMSLAAISRSDVSVESDVSIQRLEKGKPHAVAFNEQEIVIAAERGIEVR
jgi:AAA domain, putative AbiEii toxin, Type IV TA system/AAA ATPase domain